VTYWLDQKLLVAAASGGGETMGNRPVIEVTTGLAGEFLSLRYKSGSVVPWASDSTVWAGRRNWEWNGMEWNGMVLGLVRGG
jgi:hypothetical protein